ncbi:uncharacterized protein LOC144928844 [Branchiostoma floridae x Branchiostoma belcheri]
MAGGKFCVAALVVLSVLGAVEGSRSNRCSCPWGLWGSWTSCSQRCDGGTRMRFRYRSHCCFPNYDSQLSTCNAHSCCSCTWRSWGHWSSCSRTCGGGMMTRTRHRDSCCSPSSDSETMSCNTQSCCRCEWGNWHGWSSCSQTCGEGTQTRTRYSQPCCFPSHHVDTRSCHNHCDNQGGTTSTFWNRERLALTILGVLAGIALVASLLRYKLVWDRDRVIDLRGKL